MRSRRRLEVERRESGLELGRTGGGQLRSHANWDIPGAFPGTLSISWPSAQQLLASRPGTPRRRTAASTHAPHLSHLTAVASLDRLDGGDVREVKNSHNVNRLRSGRPCSQPHAPRSGTSWGHCRPRFGVRLTGRLGPGSRRKFASEAISPRFPISHLEHGRLNWDRSGATET